MKCDWTNCEAEGTVPRTDVAGRQWACLCEKHDAELHSAADMSSASWSPKRMVAAWVNAQGGPAAAAKRMTER
jgi:hypothetical protein